MERKTLLFIHHSTRISGAEISLLTLIANLDVEKYRIIIIVPDIGPLYQRLLSMGMLVKIVPILRFKKSNNPIRIISYIISILICSMRIIHILYKYGAKLIHSNSTNAFMYVSIPGLFTRIPVVWHIRDKVPYDFISDIVNFCNAKIICVSSFIVPDKLKDDPRLYVISNAVDTRTFESKANTTKMLCSKYCLPHDALLIAQVGQLIPKKNHIDFILTAERVVIQNDKVRFFIIGSDLFNEYGEYVLKLKHLIAEKGLKEYFFFIDYHDNIIDTLREIDILFHPATDEPFGRIIIEAMALKKPVIAVKNYGPSEIIKNNVTGYLVNPHDTVDMSLKIMTLLNNKNLRLTIGEQGNFDISQRYSLAQHIKEVEKVYNSFLSR